MSCAKEAIPPRMHRQENWENQKRGQDRDTPDAVNVLHPTNLLFVLVLVQGRGAKMTPPLKQHGIADQLEPRGEFQTGLLEHSLQLISRHIGGVADLVGARV